MIRLKNKHAFTLIEVLITMAIIGIALGPIYFAQGTIFKRIVTSIAAVERMFIAYDFFVDKQRDADIGDKRVTQSVDNPKTDMVYQMLPVPKDSLLDKTCNHLFVQKASWRWGYMDILYQDVLVSIVFNPPPKKQQEEQLQKGGPQAKPQPAQAPGSNPSTSSGRTGAGSDSAVKPTSEAQNVKK